MQITCRHCRKTAEFADPHPVACKFCGRLLDDRPSDATVDYVPTREGQETAAPEEDAADCFMRIIAAADDHIGGYRLLRLIGEGGMGLVWEAEQVDTGRSVALKLLSPRLSPTAENVDRFLREGKLAASLSHPRSTFVFDAGQQNGQPYIAMELMPGRTLKDLLDDGEPLPVERAVDYILDVIEGLEAAHALGVIHRDVKPSNCFLDSDGRVKVGDFGLSKSLVSDAELTQTGAFLGTPQFAAPEQVRGGVVDQRTDVYAVGATLFCLLSGRGPFVGDAAAVIARIASDPAPPLISLRPEVRKSLSRIVGRTLEKNPARRFHDLASLRRALTPFATGGVSMADIGRRLAAYTLDLLLVGVITSSITVPVSIVAAFKQIAEGSQAAASNNSGTLNAWLLLFIPGAQILYFFLAEGRWGCGLGKRLMGLRVIGLDGDRPGYGRSILRSLFVPGALGLLFLPPLLTLLESSAAAPAFFVSRAEIVSVLQIVFALVCLTTMRARNGYRGLHELASGTRVVRLRISITERTQHLPIVLPAAMPAGSVDFGPFQPVGELGHTAEWTVLQARDVSLGRAAWLYVGPRAVGGADKRRMVVRPTRPHWLQGGELPDGRWDAFEAVVGAPLTDVIRQTGGAWQECRFWLLELCGELAAALVDGTLIEPLTLDQIWITREGRLKLLDAPVRAAGAAATASPVYGGTAAERAVALLQDAVRLCTRQQILPTHVRQFANELASRAAGAETLAWSADQLREALKQPAALKWDGRLGVLAVAMGTELSLYTMLAFAAPWVLVAQLQCAAETLAALLPVVLLIPALVGFAFRGGPAFWLTRIHVLRSDGRRANRWRCAWRSFVAWTPMLVLYIVLGILAAKASPSPDLPVGQQAPAVQLNPDEPATWFLLGALLVGELLWAAFFIGAIYAIIRPQRGLQDLLSGTWLAPR